MERNESNAPKDNSMDNEQRTDLDPGLRNRNLLSDTRDEAPIDKDPDNTANVASEAGDENYADEGEGDIDYYEKRAPDNVRK